MELLGIAQSTILTAEKLILCTTCLPNIIIAKCCLILGNACELISNISAQLREVLDNVGVKRKAEEDIRRVKRRATILLAGLRMLQDMGSADSGLTSIQSEYLVGLAKYWSSLPEP